jgi:2-phosphosulfolactate phosphatase
MKVFIRSLPEGAANAVGATAIIDVFRAFTSAAVALANGASHIVMVTSCEEAKSLRNKGVGDFCMGDERGRMPDGFDFGNSPYLLSQADLVGKAIIQRTSNGTQGIVTASATSPYILAASLVTASATARALRSAGTEQVTLVAMGNNGLRSSEDEICALYLRDLVEGRKPNPEAARQMILSGSEAAKFGDPQRPWLHPADLPLSLDIDRFDFAIRAGMENGYPIARKSREP